VRLFDAQLYKGISFMREYIKGSVLIVGARIGERRMQGRVRSTRQSGERTDNTTVVGNADVEYKG
jgi:hypothetical protein